MNAADRFFVDTNVLLYCVDPAESEKRLRATSWMESLWMAGTGCLSWQVLHEFYCNAVGKMQLQPVDAREVVENLVHWKPVDTSRGLIQQAWQWMDSAQLSYWDALILAACQRSGARYLLSEDFQAGRVFDDVQVVQPFLRSPQEFNLGPAA